MGGNVEQNIAVAVIPPLIDFINKTAANPAQFAGNLQILGGQIENLVPTLEGAAVTGIASTVTNKLTSILTSSQAAIAAANTPAIVP